MSVSPTSSSFNFDGIVSGLNTSSVIDKMMSLERAPLTNLQQRQLRIQDRDSAYQAVQAQVRSFQTALQTMLLSSSVNAKSSTSSTPTVATAAPSSQAVNGSFTVNVARLATATSVTSPAPLAKGVSATAALNSAGFSLAPTSGAFTINGVQITTDVTTDTLTTLADKITDSSAGGSGTNTGVVATLVNDANGNPNFIKLTPISGNTAAIQLGAAGDTSNLLTAADLVATGVTGGGNSAAVQSGAPLSAIVTGNALSGDSFNSGTLDQSGTMTINGVQISWQASDSLSAVLNRINSSTAGVRANYDPIGDKVSLTSLQTGNQAISLSETTPATGTQGLLSTLGLVGSTQQYGQTAQYSISQNGSTGTTQYSNSNNVTNALPGVNLTLAGTGSTTITVNQDTATTLKNVHTFVDQFNQLVDLVDKDTAYNATNNQASVLTGDTSIVGIEDELRSIVSGAAPGLTGQYNSLASIGVSTGAFGSAVGSTNHLVVDEDKLTRALQSNPSAVYDVIAGSPAAVVNPDASGNAGTGSWITSMSGKPAGGSYGSYRVTLDGSGNLSSVFTPSGAAAETAVTGTVAAGGTNTNLIPGLTLQAGSLPTAGTTSTDTIWYGQPGVLGRLNDYLNQALNVGGVFDAEHQSATTDLQDVASQITSLQDQLNQRQQTYQAQFTAMEVALSQLNSQGSQLLSSLGSSMPAMPTMSASSAAPAA